MIAKIADFGVSCKTMFSAKVKTVTVGLGRDTLAYVCENLEEKERESDTFSDFFVRSTTQYGLRPRS